MTRLPEGSVPPVPEGSAAYYGVLFCAAEQRSALTALFALERELERVTAATVDPSISLIKLNWWGEEIQRLDAGEPRHPITETLLKTATMTGDVQALRSMVQISQRMCMEPDQDTSTAVELDCQRSSALYGFAAEWLAASAGGIPDRVRLAGGQLGAGVRLKRLATESTGAPVAELADLAVKSLRQGLAAIPADARASQVPLIVLGTLHLRLLTQPGPLPAGSGRHRRALASLGMITTAWRTARAASRGRLPPIARSR